MDALSGATKDSYGLQRESNLSPSGAS